MTDESSAPDFGYGHNLMHEAVATGCGVGPVMWDMRHVLPVRTRIIEPEHIIDCDADARAFNGWEVFEHKKGGHFKWDPRRVIPYLDYEQKKGRGVSGERLCEKLARKPVLNANALEYLLAYPYLIPKNWGGNNTLFLGTLYLDKEGDLRIRYLFRCYGRWKGSTTWAERNLDDSFRIAMAA